jgi:Flp pilus assembly protein CpaB
VSSRRVLILIVAVALAAASAFATFSYTSSADERALGDAELVEVWMVKKDIDKGFPGEQALDGGFLVKERIPKKFYPAKAVVDVNSLRGKVALAPLAAGLPVVDGNFVDPRVATVSFAQRIDKDKQAVTISVSDTQGVARLIVPGDRVNMIVSVPENPADGNSTAAKYMLQGVEVLAVGQAVELQPGESAATGDPNTPGQAPSVNSGLITFSVPAVEAAKIVYASTIAGGIHLTLVPPDFQPAPVPPVNRANLFA